jgi:ABC-type tungstate transport system substrate-binding protein
MAVCAIPVLLGFVLPASVLAHDALAHVATGLASEFWDVALNSLLLSASAAVFAAGFAIVLAYARRQTRSQLIQAASTLPAISYAVPGTVLAIGLLIPLAGLDNGIDGVMRSLFGLSTGLLLSGTAFAIVLAYTIRFLAASLGAVEAGLSKISRNIDAAARTLGVRSERDAVQGVSTDVETGAWRSRSPCFCRFDERAAGDAAAQALQFRYARDPGLHPRLALPLRGSGTVSAHHRFGQPGAILAWHHRRKPAGSLDEPFCRNRRKPGMGVARREISQENACVGLAISAQSG